MPNSSSHNMTTFADLKGLIVKDIRHDDDLYISTNKGVFKMTAEGD